MIIDRPASPYAYNKFDKIDLELLEQEDLFTKQAQKAYSLIG